MQRTSLIGPVILIGLGGLLLASNLSSGFDILDVLSVYWPWILIGWGVIRLVELVLWSRRPEPLFPQGIRGGEWFLVFLICVSGSVLYGSRTVLGGFAGFPGTSEGLRIFGESFDFGVEETRVPATPRILVENLRGEVIITGEDTKEIRVSGRESVRALSDEEARGVWETRALAVEQQGDLTIIRTNQESVARERSLRSYLQIRVPKNTIIQTRGRDTNWELSQLQANIEVNSDEGDATISAVKGEVKISINDSDEIRVRDTEGLVEIRSNRGEELEVDSIRGPVTISGSFGGNVSLRGITGEVRVEDRLLDLRAAAIPGEIEASRGDFTGKGITGPLRISSESKDVELRDFTGNLEMNLERGDAHIEADRQTVQPMTLDVRRGKVELYVPENGNFELVGEARRGEVENSLDKPMRIDSDGNKTILRGGAAGSPKITINAERIELAPLDRANRDE